MESETPPMDNDYFPEKSFDPTGKFPVFQVHFPNKNETLTTYYEDDTLYIYREVGPKEKREFQLTYIPTPEHIKAQIESFAASHTESETDNILTYMFLKETYRTVYHVDNQRNENDNPDGQ